MSAVGQNPPAQPESKSSKKKRAKNEAPTSVSASTPTPSNPDTDAKHEAPINGVSEEFDNSILKELQKTLRNAVKKLNATAKVDSIIAENPGKSLDELIAAKKINADQKAQALKKPALQAQIAQLEEQISQYKQFASHYEERLVSQKTALEIAHKEELDTVREKAVAEYKESHQNEIRSHLLTLSQFLRAAASIRRAGDDTAIESRAFEGVLFQVYGGSTEAVDSILKLTAGAEEKVVAVEGDVLDVTYARVKQISEEQGPPAPEATYTEDPPAQNAAPGSDPTLVNAGLTELQDTSAIEQTTATNSLAPSGTAVQPEEPLIAPSQTSIGDAANAVAESTWDPQVSESLAASASVDGWVEVPRDPTETETGVQATPAAVQPSSSWAEDIPTEAPAVPSAEGNDGFEQVVHHHQRQGSVRGRTRGRARGEGYRGRGGRGEFRGRGRGRGGDFKGGRGRGGFGNQQGNRGEPIASQ